MKVKKSVEIEKKVKGMEDTRHLATPSEKG